MRRIGLLLALACVVLLLPFLLTGTGSSPLCPFRANAQSPDNPCLAKDATISAQEVYLLRATIEGINLRLTIVALQTQVSRLTTPVVAFPTPVITAAPRPTAASIVLADSPAWGPTNAKVTVVEFSDIECPFCGLYHRDTYPKLKADYGDKVRYVFKHYPLTGIHPNAMRGALAAECAREQGKFWEFLDIAYANQTDLSHDSLVNYAVRAEVKNELQFTECLDSAKYLTRIQADMSQGDSLGVGGTPTFFINGYALVGAQPYESFKQALDAMLAQ